MNASIVQLLVLAGIAVFLILRLKSVLGTREGFEEPPTAQPVERKPARTDFEVIEGGPDRDIVDHVPEGSASADAFARMKRAEPGFGVGDFLSGARGAYEMILMSFEKGDLAEIKPFLGEDVYESFADVVSAREDQGLKIEAEFIGVREVSIAEAAFDDATSTAEITVKFIGELTSLVRDRAGEIVEGSATQIKRQKDTWTFARTMGADDPNWQLVATGE